MVARWWRYKSNLPDVCVALRSCVESVAAGLALQLDWFVTPIGKVQHTGI